jgi:hypothetical protein
MKIDRTALIMLAAARRERERRQAAEQAKAEAAVEELLRELEEMGRRMFAVRVSGRDLQDDVELAAELARAENWKQIDEIRNPHDLSRAEATALVLMVSPERALQLLAEYCRSQ